MEGDIRVYSIALLFFFFFQAVFRYMILMRGDAVCGFSCFWLTVFGKEDPSRDHVIVVLFMCALLSNGRQYFEDLKLGN